jgi:hypothetical protein
MYYGADTITPFVSEVVGRHLRGGRADQSSGATARHLFLQET